VPAVYHRRAAARPSQRPLGPITECAQPYWRPVRKYPPIWTAAQSSSDRPVAVQIGAICTAT